MSSNAIVLSDKDIAVLDRVRSRVRARMLILTMLLAAITVNLTVIAFLVVRARNLAEGNAMHVFSCFAGDDFADVGTGSARMVRQHLQNVWFIIGLFAVTTFALLGFLEFVRTRHHTDVLTIRLYEELKRR